MRLRVGTGPIAGVKMQKVFERRPMWIEELCGDKEDDSTDCEEEEDEKEIVDYMHVKDVLRLLDLNPEKCLGKILNSKLKNLKNMMIPIIDGSYDTAFVYLVLMIHMEEFMYILHKVLFPDQICPEKRKVIFFTLVVNGYAPTDDSKRLALARKTAKDWMDTLKNKKPM